MDDRASSKVPAAPLATSVEGGMLPGSALASGAIVDAAFEQAGVRMQLRKNQRIEPVAENSDAVYLMTTGVMLIEAGGDEDRHVVFGLLYPGDVFRSAFLPPLPLVRLTALDRCEVLRARRQVLLAEGPPSVSSVASGLIERVGGLHSRLSLHVASLASLSGDERVASFLLEIMLRLGRRKGLAVACDVPLSRKDMAAYLALNADTLSRVMSRLKSGGLVTGVGRNRLIVSDIDKLKALSPIGAAVQALHAA